MAVKAVNSGMIIIGGGVVKHHICNANLMVGVCCRSLNNLSPSLWLTYSY